MNYGLNFKYIKSKLIKKCKEEVQELTEDDIQIITQILISDKHPQEELEYEIEHNNLIDDLIKKLNHGRSDNRI